MDQSTDEKTLEPWGAVRYRTADIVIVFRTVFTDVLTKMSPFAYNHDFYQQNDKIILLTTSFIMYARESITSNDIPSTNHCPSEILISRNVNVKTEYKTWHFLYVSGC